MSFTTVQKVNMQEIIYQLQQCSSLIKIRTEKKILIGNTYYSMNLKGTLPDMYVREGVWKQLVLASKSLPENLAFYLFDTYRSLETQKDLFLFMKNIIHNQHPELDEEDLMAKTRTFVGDPFNLEIRHKLSHPSGGAVDLGLYHLEQNKEHTINVLPKNRLMCFFIKSPLSSLSSLPTNRASNVPKGRTSNMPIILSA